MRFNAAELLKNHIINRTKGNLKGVELTKIKKSKHLSPQPKS